MKSIVLALFAAFTLSAGSVSAASYQMIDGTIVDPIQDVRGGDSAYSGNNLEPGAFKRSDSSHHSTANWTSRGSLR